MSLKVSFMDFFFLLFFSHSSLSTCLEYSPFALCPVISLKASSDCPPPTAYLVLHFLWHFLGHGCCNEPWED